MDGNNQGLEGNATGKRWQAVLLESCGVFLLYLVLAVIMTWPLLKNIRFEVLGHPALSSKVHLWQYWWTGYSLFSADHELSWCPLLFYPSGVNTIAKFGSFMFPVAGLPFQYMFGLIAGYNVTLMVFIAATGLATYMLCRRFVSSRAACFVAGTVYAFLPYSLMENFNGATEIAVLLWIPLCFIQIDRWLKRQSLYQGLLLGLVLFCSAMSSWYYGVYLGMAVALAAGMHVLAEWRRKQLSSGLIMRLTVSFGLAIVVFALLMSSFTVGLRHSDRMRESWKRLCNEPLVASKANPDIMEVFGPWQRPVGKDVTLDPDVPISYSFAMFPGFLALALAIFGLSRRPVLPGYFIIILLFFWLLSLGPWLKVAGAAKFWGCRVPMLTLAIVSVWKDFAVSIMHSYRAICVAWFALAVLACAGTEQLFRVAGAAGLRRAVLLAALVSLVMIDSVNSAHLDYPLLRMNMEIPPAYRVLRDIPGRGAVIDVPIREHSHWIGCYIYPQILHQRPIVIGKGMGISGPGVASWFLDNIELQRDSHGELIETVNPDDALSLLQRMGFRFFILHWNWLKPEVAANARGIMEKHCRMLIDDTKNEFTIYEIVSPGGTK